MAGSGYRMGPANECYMASVQDVAENYFVMEGLSASTLTKEYAESDLPAAGIDAIQKTVAGTGDDFDDAIRQIRALQADISRYSGVSQARTVEELRSDDGLQVLFGFQDTTPFERNLANVHLFKQLGVKHVQLTYNSQNFCASGCTETEDSGLSDYGYDVIDELESHGILVDLSHAGPESAMDALEYVSKPTVFSHSNPRSVHDHPRNISDEHIKAAVETGGIIGINAYPDFVSDDPDIDDVLEHIQYLDDLVDVENVTLGLDFVDNTPPSEMAHLEANPFYSNPPFTYPDGLQSERDTCKLAVAMLDDGFTKSEVSGVMGENLLEVYQSVWN